MMMNVIVGCDAIDAGPDLVRLHMPGGSLKTIPWSAVGMAALPVNDKHMTFEGELSPITKLRATHDALWIEHGVEMIVVMLEKDHENHDSIVAAFGEHLGAKWMADGITMQAASMRMMKMSNVSVGGRSMMKMMLIAVAAMFLLTLLAIVISSMSRQT
jgi:hypothetical protein